MSSIRDHDYYRFVRRQIVQEYRLLEPDTQLASQMELASLFFARCADLYLGDGGRIAFVMPISAITAEPPSDFSSFSSKGGMLKLRLEKVMNLDQMKPLFDVPTCVLVASKEMEP